MELDFEQQLNFLIPFHIDEHVAAAHLLQILEEDTLARQIAGTPKALGKNTCYEAIIPRGLEQQTHLFGDLDNIAAIAANRFNLSADQIATINELRVRIQT